MLLNGEECLHKNIIIRIKGSKTLLYTRTLVYILKCRIMQKFVVAKNSYVLYNTCILSVLKMRNTYFGFSFPAGDCGQ